MVSPGLDAAEIGVVHADHERELPLGKTLLFPALSHALTEPQSVLSGIHKASVCDTMFLVGD